MSKNMSAEQPYVPPPAMPPPSYSQAVGSGPYPPGPSVPYPVGPASYPDPNQPKMGQPQQPTIVTTVVPLGPNSTRMTCPHCHFEISTSTKSEPGLIAYVSGALIALFGCWLGCCLIPCCIDECMDIHHNCPNCKAFLGRYRR